MPTPAETPVADASASKADATLENLTQLPAQDQLPSNSKWRPGKNYQPIVPAQPTNVPAGKVEVVEVFAYWCPHCAHFNDTTFPELKTKYIDTGKVRYILREFPFDPRAEAGFMLARCAGDNYFPMVDVLFKQQANWAAADGEEVAIASAVARTPTTTPVVVRDRPVPVVWRFRIRIDSTVPSWSAPSVPDA